MRAVVRDEEGSAVVEQSIHPQLTCQALLACNRREAALLSWIDPYGDTVFNKFQCRAVVRELEIIAASSTRDLTELIDMARGCGEATHQYLWFVGD